MFASGNGRMPNPFRFRDLVELAINFIRTARSEVLNQSRPRRDTEIGAKFLNRLINAGFSTTFNDDKILRAGLRTQRFQLATQLRKQRNDAAVFTATFRLRRTNGETLGVPIDVFPTRFKRFAKSQAADAVKRRQNAKFRVVATVD